MAARSFRLGLFLLGALVPGACDSRDRLPKLLELQSFLQAGRSNVALNESLVLHFSEPLDRSSIHAESVRITGPDGEAVDGRFEVLPYQLLFHPELPRSPDLEDGGFLPGQDYRVELAGFPRPDGIRSQTQVPLAATLRFSFRTVGREAGESLFLDLFPTDDPPYLLLEESILGPLSPIRIQCGRPLDPTTLEASEFELRAFRTTEENTTLLDRIPLRVRLVENQRDGARIELRPTWGEARGSQALRALDPGTVYLWIDPTRLSLCGLGGAPVKWRPQATVEIEVVGPRVGRLEEDFSSTDLRSPEALFDLDGTAFWDVEAGEVRIRYPRAAGDGREGEVILQGAEPRKDVHAELIRVRDAAQCDLVGEGTVVLRSQGALWIDGNLRRRVETGEHAWQQGESHAAWRLRTRGVQDWSVPSMGPDFEPPRGRPRDLQVLSAWLASVQERDLPWTILIAGGDLFVQGELEVDGPLLLVAGGWVRVPGQVASREAWILREGGGSFDPAASEARLVIDEPSENVLRRPLTFGVLSDRVRPPLGVTRWRGARPTARPGSGAVRLRFLGEKDLFPSGTEVFGPVQELSLLEGCQAVRFRIDLTLPAGSGDPWDPPTVDSLEVSWYEPPRGPLPRTPRSGL